MNNSIDPEQLSRSIDRGANLRILDVRKIHDRVQVEHPVPGAEWRDPGNVEAWSDELDRDAEVIVYCVHGHHVSQSTRDALIEKGFRARIVEGGIEGWQEYVRTGRSGNENNRTPG